jgi:four helix bundle protein
VKDRGTEGPRDQGAYPKAGGSTRLSEIEQTDVYLRSCDLSDEIWLAVKAWDRFDQKTVGEQLCRAIDSMPANLEEGDGRLTDRDSRHFFVIARASVRESRHWRHRAKSRKLITEEQGQRWIDEMNQLLRMVHGIVKYRTARALSVSESPDVTENDGMEVPWSLGPSVPFSFKEVPWP